MPPHTALRVFGFRGGFVLARICLERVVDQLWHSSLGALVQQLGVLGQRCLKVECRGASICPFGPGNKRHASGTCTPAGAGPSCAGRIDLHLNPAEAPAPSLIQYHPAAQSTTLAQHLRVAITTYREPVAFGGQPLYLRCWLTYSPSGPATSSAVRNIPTSFQL